MSLAEDYDTEFYSFIEDGSRRSARAFGPYILHLLPKIRSTVDFGCGSGTWLAEFQRAGIDRIFGLDFGIGAKERLFIELDRYKSADLGLPISVVDFDLCISLEVAEHLSSDSANVFVRNLTEASPRVLFSAAITNQGGHHHVNERPPDYWILKFEQRHFRCFDVLRPMVWDDGRISWWYRQNALLFIREDLNEEVERFARLPTFQGRYLVHPSAYQARHNELLRTIAQCEEKLGVAASTQNNQ
jgi:SAM-dependent methyltransferase